MAAHLVKIVSFSLIFRVQKHSAGTVRDLPDRQRHESVSLYPWLYDESMKVETQDRDKCSRTALSN